MNREPLGLRPGAGLTTWVARAAVRGFINYLKKYEERKVDNNEPTMGD
ncbi:hypothetical protein M1N50_03620 [Dehalococcoidia bacterium]|nr:hypothetical protein [Dehalococcoidia bacterium]